MNGQERVEPNIVADAADGASAPFVGQWQRLVSVTNWEKGRIICGWRETLLGAGARPTEYSDEAWSQRVGNVSGQHVGRLRRVFQRFGSTHEGYAGLYWSHFHAAVDWNDAELWLEGSVQNGWSVAQMRAQRWEAFGAPSDLKPRDEDIVTAEWDEDAEGPREAEPAELSAAVVDVRDPADAGGTGAEGAGAAATDPPSDSEDRTARDTRRPVDPAGDGAERSRPFADLPSLPDDLAEALEVFKLAILAHRRADWKAVAPADVLQALDALKQLVVAPVESGSRSDASRP